MESKRRTAGARMAILIAGAPGLLMMSAYAGDCDPAGVFENTPRVPVGDRPNHAVSADFNGDGTPDLATANQESDDVSVVLGVGDGTFGPETRFPAGDRPDLIVVADLNNDGAPDLITRNHFSDDFSILLGVGDGAFVPAAAVPFDESVSDLAVADFNGDGAPDLAVAQFGGPLPGGRITVLSGQGDGTFVVPDEPTINDLSPIVAIAVADFNQDGATDLAALAVADQVSDILWVYLGDGAGQFVLADEVEGLPIESTDLLAGDLSGDGAPDIVALSASDPLVTVTFGQGDGTLQPATNFGAVPQQYSVSGALADLNGDGALDLVVTLLEDNAVAVFLNLGAGAFDDPVQLETGADPRDVLVFDANGDGALDLVTANPTSDDLSVFLNTCLGCPGDLDGSGAADAADLAALLGAWGRCSGDCPADLDGDGVVGAADLALLLGAWGPCAAP